MSPNTGTTEVCFSPYGFVSEDFKPRLFIQKIPQDWVAPPSTPGIDRATQWTNWREGVIDQISAVLWPRWDTKPPGWRGYPSTRMNELTRADFRVFSLLEKTCPARGLDTKIDSPLRAPNAREHRELFFIDDDTRAPEMHFSPFEDYDHTLTPERARLVSDRVVFYTQTKLLNSIMQFKVPFQRPRPYQTAMLLGEEWFSYEKADTALTPSMCSGHCLQGLIAYGGIFEFFESQRWFKSDDNRMSMLQLAVDFGDRRVMAGVHYPSDNLCSWILTMKFADCVYRDERTKRRLREAITNQSRVYKAMKTFSKTVEGSIYDAAFDLFDKS